MQRRILLVSLIALASAGAEERHWAYEPPAGVELPGQEHPVDVLLGAAWAKAGLKPSAEASPRQRLERAAYTLTGLPPSDGQIRRIEADPGEETWAALVEEFLASPAYGERWARHWMDVARYADTLGYNFDQDNRYPFAYTYRDWLIRAFNEDMPYDRFIKLQIAADHLTDREDHPDLAALGFITVGPRSGGVETIDDRVDVITRGFLSSTVSCARCHHHKTDPISTEDYYSIYSILENTREPDDKPIIGKPADEAAHTAFLEELAKLEANDLAKRQEIVDQLRTPESSAIYLELAWLSVVEEWDSPRISSESFKRGRYRLKAVEKWNQFLKTTAFGDEALPRLRQWQEEMAAADDAGRKALSLALATEWAAASGDHELAKLAGDNRCPLSYGPDRIREFMDQEDDNQRRARAGALAKLQIEHPGSPPRAMNLRDRENWSPAQVFRRGNPGDRSDPFERHWLGFLGGGTFEEGKSPRLSLAEKIADPANPMTARVIVNRVWGWHFGQPLTEPGDFGPQQPEPALRPLLDWLATRFTANGGSIKELHRLLLTSHAFRLETEGPEANIAKDEANRYFWKWNRRRAEFEAMRDRLLATAGSLDTGTVGGRSLNLDNPSSDTRRTVYAFVDRYELPGTFVSFDLPHPDHHSPKRVETTVPQQALYFLNSPLLLRQAAKLAADPEFRALPDDSARLHWLYQRIFNRPPTGEEADLALGWLSSITPEDYLPRLGGHWEVRHATDAGGTLGEVLPFPLFHERSWQTGPELSSAPIPWLHASGGHGHASSGHALILRWRAHAPGKARMAGSIERTQESGDTLAWSVANPQGTTDVSGPLPPKGKSAIEGNWIDVFAGDTIDFVLRAPDGHNSAGVKWNLKILGMETDDGQPVEIGNFSKDFPTSNEPPPAPAPADPWADLIQMLWASNEFHYID